MVDSITSAIQAYRVAARAVMKSVQSTTDDVAVSVAPRPSESASSGEFAHLVRSSLEDAVRVNKKAEALSLQGIAGEADMRDVVLAVGSAEHTLNTVMTVRDRVISAYQEIVKMPM